MIHPWKLEVERIWEQIPHQNRTKLAKHLFFLTHKQVEGVHHDTHSNATKTDTAQASETAGSGIRPPVITTASGRESGEPEASIPVSGKGAVSGMV